MIKNKTQIDKKGIIWFLIITFGLTILATFTLWVKGYYLNTPSQVAQISLVGIMFIPGITSIIVRKLITKENFSDAGLNFGNWKMYLHSYILIPFIFLVAFTLTAIFIDKPDWSLTAFTKQFNYKLPLPPKQMILGIFLASMIFAPIINTIPAFGEELGWRGYLLPKLLPLGNFKALIISGFIWGMWHIPFIIMLKMHYGEQKILGTIVFVIIATLLGIYIGYLRIISGSVFLASFAHGVFNAQFYGIGMVIFPNVNPVLGGMSGIIGIFVLLIPAIQIFSRIRHNQ